MFVSDTELMATNDATASRDFSNTGHLKFQRWSPLTWTGLITLSMGLNYLRIWKAFLL
jgi:hypothetical protein